MSRSVKIHLSVMMFLQYTIPGFVLPILSHYLKNHLGFDALQVGKIMAMPAIAAILAPFAMTYVVDRLISAERLLALCHLLGGLVMLVLARQAEFRPFLLLYFVHGILFVPTFALTNAVTFHHVTDAARDFGRIRMWGPASWVVVAWSFSFLWLRHDGGGALNSRLPDALVLAAVASFVLAAYALWLPRSRAKSDRPANVGAWRSLRVFLRPNLLLLSVLTFFTAMVHQFYYFGMSPFLSQVGLPDRYIMPAMSMGQFGEMFVMAILGFCLARFGVKRMLLVGILAQVARCLVFAYGNPVLAVAVIPSHGICYACFFAVAFIYVDKHSTRHTRAGAQQMFNLLIAGFGNLAGNLVAGKIGTVFTVPGTAHIHFRSFWTFSASVALGIAVVIAVFFREDPPERAVPTSPPS